MEINRASHWLQIGANIGIIVSLLLVGFQLKQNADLLSTELLYEESNRSIGLEAQLIGESGAEVWAKAMSNPDDLTLAEQRVMEAIYWSFIEGLRATRMLAEKGLLTDDEWKQRIDVEVPFYFGNDFGKSWWGAFTETGPSGLNPDLLDLLNERIASYPNTWTRDYVQRSRSRLPE